MKGIAAGYINKIFSLLTPMILTPLYVRYLGQDAYGIWIVILSLSSYLFLVNLGFSQTVANQTAVYYGSGREKHIGEVISTGWFLSFAVVLLSCVLSYLGLKAAEKYVFKSLDPASSQAVMIYTLLFLLSIPLQVFSSALRSIYRIHEEQGAQILSTILRLAGVAFVLIKGGGLAALAWVQGICLLLPGVLSWLRLSQISPYYKARFRLINRNLARTMLAPSIAFFMLQISGGILFSTDNLVIGHFLGSAEVPSYAVPQRLSLTILGIAGLMMPSLMPAYSAYFDQKRFSELKELYAAASQMMIFLGGCAALCFALSGRDFIEWWVGASLHIDAGTFYLLTAFMLIQIVLFPADTVLMATSQHKGYAFVALFEAVLNLMLSIFWIRHWGTAGVIAATITARVLTNGWYMPFKVARLLVIETSLFPAMLLRKLILPGAAALFTAWAANQYLMGAGSNGQPLLTFISCVIFSLLFIAADRKSAFALLGFLKRKGKLENVKGDSSLFRS